MTYKVVFEYSDEGIAVSVPCLPGCHSQGGTEQEALENISAAIIDYLAVVNELTRDKVFREVEVSKACMGAIYDRRNRASRRRMEIYSHTRGTISPSPASQGM